MDLQILLFIQEHIKCDFLDPIMAFFSYLGNLGIFWGLISIALMFIKKTRKFGIMMLASLVIASIPGEFIIKNIVNRPRPFVDYPDIIMNIKKPSGASFPSIHATSSFSAAYIAFKADKRFGIAAFVLAVIIAFSRLYNFVHYPSDVLIGAIFGIVVAIIVYKFCEKKKIFDKTNRGKPNE